MRLIWILVVSASLALVACGGKDDDKGKKGDKVDKGKSDKTGKAEKSSGPVAACDRRENEGLCAEYHGKMATKDWVKNECDLMKAPMIDSCPTEGSIGRCVEFEGGPSEIQSVWYAGKEAMLDMCEKTGGRKVTP